MKFELIDSNKQISDIELINDLRNVANNLGKRSLKMREYCKENGSSYNYQTAKKRFGSWEEVLKKAGLQTEISIHGVEYGETSIREQLLIEDIINVSKKLNNSKITILDYEKNGKYGSATIQKRFGGWNKAKEKANLEIGRKYNTSIEEYFQNILLLWTHFGRQPKYAEVVKPLSKLSISSYENKFGTWRTALEKFVEYINENHDDKYNEYDSSQLVDITGIKNMSDIYSKEIKIKRTPRNINLRLRWVTLKRDNFTCRKCGQSPAKGQNIELHVDHIVPWSKGGETEINNLETLCSNCNLGKSNLT